MARAAVLLLVALVAGAFVSHASAKLALCDPKATPAAPVNVRIIKNVITSKGPEVTVSWTNPTKSTDGCPSFYRVQTFVNGRNVAEDGVMMSDPLKTPVTFSKILKAGDIVSFKVYAMNKDTQKKSPTVSAQSSVKAASAGASTDFGRKML